MTFKFIKTVIQSNNNVVFILEFDQNHIINVCKNNQSMQTNDKCTYNQQVGAAMLTL